MKATRGARGRHVVGVKVLYQPCAEGSQARSDSVTGSFVGMILIYYTCSI